MRWNSSVVNSTRCPISRLPSANSATVSPAALATKAMVGSFNWVAAWITPTTTPITSTVSSSGPATQRVATRPPRSSVRASSGVIAALRSDRVEAGGQGADDQHPAIDQHEQQDLEGRRDQH